MGTEVQATAKRISVGRAQRVVAELKARGADNLDEELLTEYVAGAIERAYLDGYADSADQYDTPRDP